MLNASIEAQNFYKIMQNLQEKETRLIDVSMNDLQALIKSTVLECLQDLPTSKQEMHDKLLTIEQAADFLKLSKATVYSKVSMNQLPVMKRSKRLYFSYKDLLKYLRDGKRKTVYELRQELSAKQKKGGVS